MSAAAATLHLGGPAPAPRRRDLRAELLGAAALCVLLSAGVQLTLLVAPLLTMHVFDGVLASRNLGTLAVLSIAFTLALLLGGLLRHLRAALLAALAERLGRRLQLGALAATVRIAVAGTPERAALALQDVSELRRMLGGAMLADLLDLLGVPVALAFLYALHPLFFVVGLAAFLVKAVLAMAAEAATRGRLAEATRRAARSNAELSDWLRQPDAVLGLGMLEGVLRRWMPGWLGALALEDAAQRRVRGLQALMELANFGQQIAIVVAGAWLLTERACSPGVMLAATTMVGFATAPVVALAQRWRDWGHGVLAWRRLTALVVEGAPPPLAPVDPAAPPGLLLEAVTLCLPDGRALAREVTLHIPGGAAWAVLGPNGVGKTSLLRGVLGLQAPALGRVLLDGQDTARAGRSALGPRIGYLAQEPLLLEGSVAENIARFGGDVGGAVAAARRAGAHEMLGRLQRGYDTPAGPGAGLSGGQQRLVALSRALLGRPRLVVLDEPEAGLDAPAREALREAVAAAKAEGTIVLLVTHAREGWAGVLDGALHLEAGGGWRAERMGDAA